VKCTTVVCSSVLIGCAALAMPMSLAAQEHNEKHVHYKLVDLGTFGGPASYVQNGFDGVLNNQGAAVGWADTSTPDPYPNFCFSNCYVVHAFQSQDGVLTDLGTLPGGASSQTTWITATGLISGNSQNGQIDPLFPGFPQNRAVLWQNGVITDLGTLPEGGYESFASSLNSRGQVVGFALNIEACDYSLAEESTAAVTQATTAAPVTTVPQTLTPADAKTRIRALLMNRNRRFVPRLAH
jgi:uncharacterized membrane protein